MLLRGVEKIRAAVACGQLTPEEVLEAAAVRNAQLDQGPQPIHAFLSTIFDRADGITIASLETDPGGQRAEPPEPGGENGGRLALRGVPIAVKDNICTVDLPTTCGSKILDGYHSPFLATALRRLKSAGAVIVGKTNLDEFAMGSSTENSAYGPTRNPVERSRVPGGSSGGSAAAVAAGVVPAALGSSTGGSVRQPASFCGVVGVKPTYGRVSRYGLVAFASSLDQIGVLANTVRDAATVLEVISGFDPFDATSQDRPAPRAIAGDEVSLTGTVIGIPREYLDEGLDSRIGSLVRGVLDLAAREGAEIRELSLPTLRAALRCYYVIAPAEASSNLARFDGVRYGSRAPGASTPESLYERSRGQGFGPEVKRRLLIGTYALSAGYYEAYYLRAQSIRAAVTEDFDRAFAQGVDTIFAPTTPTPAFSLGEKVERPDEMCLADVYTVSANLAGIPAVSIPIGHAGLLPVGGQLMSPRWDEERMLGIAARLEELVKYEHPLCTPPHF